MSLPQQQQSQQQQQRRRSQSMTPSVFIHPELSRLSASSSDYTWSQWKLDIEEDAWSLYWALTKTIEDSGLNILDQMEFADFMAVCKKYTSEPIPPRDASSTSCAANRSSSGQLTGSFTASAFAAAAASAAADEDDCPSPDTVHSVREFDHVS